uniref:TlpA family protein disulfide reductase n=1 Tax=Flavobacterium sp. TaxID=239 RepID=UPI00404920C3
MRVVYFVLGLVFFVSCQNDSHDFLSVSLNNYEGDTLKIEGIDYEKSIVKNKEGIFNDTISIPYKGLYSLVLNNKKSKLLYLEPGIALNIQISHPDSLQNATFEGTYADENNFMKEKMKLIESIYGNTDNEEEVFNMYRNEEAAFLALNDDYRTKMNDLIENANLKNTYFKEKELEDVTYHITKYNLMYPDYHGYVTNNREFKTSENFPKLADDFNVDDEDAFKFSLSYRVVVGYMFQNKMYENNEYDKAFERGVTQLKNLKSQVIKNELVRNLIYQLSFANEDLTERYNALMDITTDVDFEKELTKKYEILQNLVAGKPSPSFENYRNHDGSKTSLADLRGKFVYIDVWATWCGPCIGEIPSLQAVEKQFHDANIAFVSISVDNEKDFEKWQNYVADKNLGGIQLFADNNWESEFVQNYAVDGIPRFILLNPAGEIVNADAPRPSDEKLVQDLKALGL